MKQRHSFFKRNGLLLTFVVFMLLTLAGQIYTGWKECNEERQANEISAIPFNEYLHSGHFIQATFENWESDSCRWACMYS